MTDQTSPITQPIVDAVQDKKVYLAIASTYKDSKTGQLFAHKDLVEVQRPYAEEAHIAPMNVTERFGDVESWVSYICRFADGANTHLTWNRGGFKATLDYANDTTDAPGRCTWVALMPFRASSQWDSWSGLIARSPLRQKEAIECIEDLAADIVDPSPADLMALLRTLRASVNATADTELRPDGTTKVAFTRDSKVATAKDVELPPSFWIAIPVLKGHVNADGQPVRYRIEVRLRVSVDDAAKLTLRFAIPSADQVFENVYAERVQAAKGLLGESFSLLRASDG